MPRSSRADRALGCAAVLTSSAAAVLGLLVAPPDAVQGQVQRLMYVHVPAAWTGYLCFAVVLVASVGYLARRDLRWDRRAQAAAEVGVGMTALAVALGSLWGHSTWGVWWTWDARLVTTVVLLLLYVGQLGARDLGGDAAAGARRAAVLGVAGFVQVPVVHFSVVWWRTLHQPATVLAPSVSPPLDPQMALALGVALLGFTLTAAWVFLRRLRQLERRAAVTDVRVPAQPVPGPAPVVVTPSVRRS